MRNTKRIAMLLVIVLFLSCFSVFALTFQYYLSRNVSNTSFQSAPKTELIINKIPVLIMALAPISGYESNNSISAQNGTVLGYIASIEHIVLNILWLLLFMYIVFIAQSRKVIIWQKCCDGKK